jgi:Ice-binding-like
VRITLLQEAQLEFLAAIGHYEAERPGLGQRFKDEVDRSLLWIAAHPELHRPRPILTPGVYFFSSSAQLTGTLTLNDQGNPDAEFVFQIGSTLTTASGSSVVTINSGDSPGCNVFWQVGSSATLGTTTAFEGNILALTSITADTGATVLDGRLLARNGAVTLDSNTITVPICVPEASSFWAGACCASLFAWQWLVVWRRKAGRS